MYLHVNMAAASAAIELRERDNFRDLSIRIAGEANTDQLSAILTDYGRLDDDKHAYLNVAALCALAGDALQNNEWQNSFNSMIGYARSKGWVDQHGAVRAHIETEVLSDP